jgi:mxaK protein
MNVFLRRCLRTLILMMLACAALLAWQLVDYWRLSRLERELAAARTAAPLPEKASAAAVLARAQVLVRERGPGAGDAALELYRQVEAEGSEVLRRIARYDTANLYLRQAQQEIDRGESARAVPLIELAKGIYRGLLREVPADWDLRYNLEHAVRILPEEDPDSADRIQAAPENSERAPATLRGTSLGLP